MEMLITRPQPDAEATRERLNALGIEAEIAPMMSRQNLPFNVPSPEGFGAVALTSTNALRSLVDADLVAPFVDKPVFAVGDRTANEARALGFSDVTAAEGTLGTLVTALARAKPEGPIFYPAGKHLSGDLAGALAPHGHMVVTTPVYEMVAEETVGPEIVAGLETGKYGAALFYSRRTAEIFCNLVAPLMTPELRRALPVLCLSENVASPLLKHHFSRVLLADHPSEDAMMALALAFAREQSGS